MSRTFTIRQMQPRDCGRVAYIDEQCIRNAWSKEDFDSLFQYMENHYLVAECEHQIVGFVGLIQFVDSGDITHIAVLPEYRGNRIATALMKGMFLLAQKNGIESIHLEVRQSNQIAQKLYEQLGFERIHVRRQYYTNPVEDAVIMIRNLSEEKIESI